MGTRQVVAKVAHGDGVLRPAQLPGSPLVKRVNRSWRRHDQRNSKAWGRGASMWPSTQRRGGIKGTRQKPGRPEVQNRARALRASNLSGPPWRERGTCPIGLEPTQDDATWARRVPSGRHRRPLGLPGFPGTQLARSLAASRTRPGPSGGRRDSASYRRLPMPDRAGQVPMR